MEDDRDSLELVRAIVSLVVSRTGHRSEFVLARRGLDALRSAGEHIPDLVLLDLGLPDIPGEEVMTRLREDPRTAAVPVIVLTAKTHPGQPMPDDYDAYVTKPIHDVQRFMRIVEGAIA